MLTQFLKLKYRTFRPQGGVQVRGVDIVNCSLERSTSFIHREGVELLRDGLQIYA